MEDKIYELLNRMYSDLSEKIGDLNGKVENIEGKLGSMEGRLGNIEAEVADLKKVVLRLETDHGNKLDALFDGYKQNSDRLDRIEAQVSRQEEFIIKRVK